MKITLALKAIDLFSCRGKILGGVTDPVCNIDIYSSPRKPERIGYIFVDVPPRKHQRVSNILVNVTDCAFQRENSTR